MYIYCCVIYYRLERYTESEELLEPMRYVRFSDEGFSVGAKRKSVALAIIFLVAMKSVTLCNTE